MTSYNWNDLTPSEKKAIQPIVEEAVASNGTLATVLDFAFHPFLTSPNGTKYYLKVANDGTLSTTTTK